MKQELSVVAHIAMSHALVSGLVKSPGDLKAINADVASQISTLAGHLAKTIVADIEKEYGPLPAD